MNILSKFLPNKQLLKFKSVLFDNQIFELMGSKFYDLYYETVESLVGECDSIFYLAKLIEQERYLIDKSDKATFFMLCAYTCYYVENSTTTDNIPPVLNRVLTFLKTNDDVAYNVLSPYIFFVIGKIDEREFKIQKVKVEKFIELLTAHDSEKPDIEYSSNVKILDIEHEYFSKLQPVQLIDDYTYKSKKLTLLKEYDISRGIKDPEDIEMSYLKKHLHLDYEFNKITSTEYEKKFNTLNKEKWYKFNVNIDEKDPSLWEFDIDYNQYFVDWLIDNGYGLDASVIAQLKEDQKSDNFEFDTLEDAIEHFTVEFWFKNNMTKIVAGFLKADDRNTFRPAVVGEPSATIVEELQIDDSIRENADEGFKEFLEQLKNRKSYK